MILTNMEEIKELQEKLMVPGTRAACAFLVDFSDY